MKDKYGITSMISNVIFEQTIFDSYWSIFYQLIS